MLTLTEIRTTIESTEISDEQFLNLHIVIESYLKRLLLIGLRNKNVQYKTATKCVNKFYVQPSEMMKLIWKLLNISSKELENDKTYTPINNAHLNFTSVYRNKRLHGVISEIEDKDLLILLIKLDKAYIQLLENCCKRIKNASCFDPPKKWGITKRGTINNVDEVMLSILNKRNNSKQMTRDDAEKLVKKLKL